MLSTPLNVSYGLYSCPTTILKCASHSISHISAEIVNLSIETGDYPAKLKLAKIVPLFKDGDELDVNNYRPISLLSNFSRIFLKLISKRLRTVSTIVTAHIFCACQGSRATRKKCATRRTRGLVLSPVSLGGSGYFLWKRCVVFQQMKNNLYFIPCQFSENRRSVRMLHFLPYDRSDRTRTVKSAANTTNLM